MREGNNLPASRASGAAPPGAGQSTSEGHPNSFLTTPPTVSLPKGGGAIRGMGEKFAANPVTGTGSVSVPIALSPGRSGFGPQLALGYDSGAGQGPFGLGWHLALPGISRKTDKGLPRYLDAQESDVFLLSGAEDLVPVSDAVTGQRVAEPARLAGRNYDVRLYRPRIEGLFSRIERWADIDKPEEMFWRTISRDNITTWYGRDTNSRIFDPDDPRRIYQWLICQTHDDKGNVNVYEYIADDSNGVDVTVAWEANRIPSAREANRYLKRILYGNTLPYLPRLDPEHADPLPVGWMFEAVLDYGDHTGDCPTPRRDRTTPGEPWPARADAFSRHRAGFEIRTYRLCRRVLMFHHFPDDSATGNDCLVRSTDFGYQQPGTSEDPAPAGYATLRTVTQRSFQRAKKPGTSAGHQWHWRDMPPVTFKYSRPAVNPSIQAIDSAQLDNLPVGTQGAGFRWMDLDGEGLSGVLAERAGAWYYKSNWGNGTFGPMREVSPMPSTALAGGGRRQFMDLAGDGAIDVVDFGGATPGFHARNRDEGWKRHVPFASLPNVDWQDPNLRFLDLTGDGHADALITEHDAFTWYPSLDERGFDSARCTRRAHDEDSGPQLVFADGTQTIFLADMCGDGLTDLVRIRNAQVCYWPNLGYGRFGRKVTLGNSPRFDHPDLFDPERIRLTDIDGSGPVDIIYLGRNGANLYFNRSGNSLSDPMTVDLPVATENAGAVQVADLLGNGTACLVWNSHLPADSQQPVRYIDLMGEKPHLLVAMDNNLGGSTEIEYTPSTRFYLQDKLAGRPWTTRLPFPVHCVKKITIRDKWRGTAFSTTYSYHHGYFDGVEREFRGFGRVETLDVESYGATAASNIGSRWVTADQTVYQPPVKSITWYHTGASMDRERVLGRFANEYFPQRFADRMPGARDPGSFQEKPLQEPQLAHLDADEWREALRACKGRVLRQEVYELDIDDFGGAALKQTPVRLLSAATHNWNVERIQPKAGNPHAVFLVTEVEALTYHYELDLRGGQPLQPDPRIAHTLNLRHDEYGNVQQSVAIGYGRWQPGNHAGLPEADLIDQVQAQRHIVYTETRYTGDCIAPGGPAAASSHVSHHRLRVPCEVQAYELTGFAPVRGRYFDLSAFRDYALSDTIPDQGAMPVARRSYHQIAQGGAVAMRLIEHTRTLFFDDDPSGPRAASRFLKMPLPLGTLGRLGLTYEQYKLALTEELLDAVFTTGRLEQGAPSGGSARDALKNWQVSGYLSGGDADTLFGVSAAGEFWMRSGIAGFADDAAGHFFLPEQYTDAFGNKTSLAYDDFDLFIRRSTDAKGNVFAIADEPSGRPLFDYRVLAPVELVDASGNHAQVGIDIFGLVVASAIKGKRDQSTGRWQGDHLDDFTFEIVNPPSGEIVAFATRDSLDEERAADWLAGASSRFIYHFGDEAGQWARRMASACTIEREQHVGQLSTGTASPLQVALECSDGSGYVLMKKSQAEPDPDTGAARWIVNGLTILNNKGKPVRQYEPAFSAEFGCELPRANGVSTTTYYDAGGRVMRVEMPDGTFSRVEFSPWCSRSFDANDTVLDTRWYVQRGAPDPAVALPADASGRITVNPDFRAAWLAARHANTPAETHFDSLGREVIAIAHNRTDGIDEKYLTFTRLDAEGKPLWIRDARGNLVMQYIAPAKPNDDPGDDMPANAVPCYDIAGNLLYQHGMDAGDRWMLMAADGKAMLAWDVNGESRVYRTDYDSLRRPTAQWLAIDGGAPLLVEKYEYQDASRNDGANLNGQLIRHYDTSGRIETIRRDFKGNVQELHRTLNNVPDASVVDWQTDPPSQLESEPYVKLTEHDALGRMTRICNWHRPADNRVAIYLPRYNKRGALEAEDMVMRAVGYDPASGTSTPAIRKIRYNAKGQKEYLELGNGTVTEYTYDAATYRLTNIKTRRPVPAGDRCSTAFLEPALIQDLRYTYDPVGNITEILDAAQAVVHHGNQRIDPVNRYEYDALYRLVRAQGKENAATTDAPSHIEGAPLSAACPAADPAALRNYTQTLRYDSVGNIEQMRHAAAGGSWTRDYAHAFDDPAQPASNRLWQTWTGGDRAQAVTYRHDTHGNMLNLANVADGHRMLWDHRDMIRRIDLVGGGIANYQYDAGKQRTRKRIVDQNGLGGYWERIYLDGYERYRRYTPNGATPVEEIESHHLFEGDQRVLLVDDVVTASDPLTSPRPDHLAVTAQTLFRYQYSNHLGSACLELDHRAQIISYEEYHPYGTSAYRSLNGGIEAPAKRYRFTGMERDEESGLNYHGSRCYSVALGRWVSSDPIGIAGGLNLFCYCRCTPTVRLDRKGEQDKPAGNEHHKICNACHPEASESVKEAMQIRDRETRAQPDIRPTAPGAVREALDKFENETLPKWVADEPRKESDWDERVDDPEHVRRVQTLANMILVRVELELGDTASTQAKLEVALDYVTQIRQQTKDYVPKFPNASRSVLVRDAQYYLWGRAGPGLLGGGRDIVAAGGEYVMKPTHEVKKFIERQGDVDLGTDGRSSDKGGYAWFRLGLSHEEVLRDDEVDRTLPPRLIDASAVPRLTPGELESLEAARAKEGLENPWR